MQNEKRSKGMQKLVECSAFIAIVNRLRNNGNISEKEYEEIRKKEMFLLYNNIQYIGLEKA